MAPHYDQEQNYWDGRGAQEYVSLSPHDQALIRQWIGTIEPGFCLDLGGGSGMGARLLAPTAGVQVITLDISLSMLRHCAGFAIQGDAIRLPFSGRTFSTIIAAAFFHHLPGRESELLAECQRVLKPGGRILGYDPTASCWQNQIFMGSGPFRLKFFSPDERPIDPSKFARDLAANGFDSPTIRYFSFRNQRITAFEGLQRWVLNPIAHGPLAPRLRRWFYWQATCVRS